MAKKAAKKAAKKKAPKRKAAKRKAATRKAPTRKPARRPGTTPATAPATATQAVTITLGCNGNNCAPDQDPIHMKPGDTVVLRAPSNDVKVHFTGGTSPFVSGTVTFTVAKGTSQTETVTGPYGRYKFHMTCSNPGCGNLAQDPSMIVP